MFFYSSEVNLIYIQVWFCVGVLLHIDIIKIIWRFRSFKGGGRPQVHVPLHAIFQARTGTYVGPLT